MSRHFGAWHPAGTAHTCTGCNVTIQPGDRYLKVKTQPARGKKGWAVSRLCGLCGRKHPAGTTNG